MPELDLTRAARMKVQGGEVLRLRGLGFAWLRPLIGAGWSVAPGDRSAVVSEFPPLTGAWAITAGDRGATIVTFPKV